MINTMSPTLASMLKETPASTGGNMAFFGNNGYEPVSTQQFSYPSPKEMLINGMGYNNSPVMQNYNNPYLNYNNGNFYRGGNYNNYGVNPCFYGQGYYGNVGSSGCTINEYDLQFPEIKAIYEASVKNCITFDQELSMEVRIAKKIMKCAAVGLGLDEEETKQLVKKCDPPEMMPSEYMLKEMNKRPNQIGKPIRPMKVRLVYGDGRVIESDPAICPIKDFRTMYHYGGEMDKRANQQLVNMEYASYIDRRMYETAPERECDKATGLIDLFNNYMPKTNDVYTKWEMRQQGKTLITQLYDRKKFMKMMKSMNILGYRDIDNPELAMRGDKNSYAYKTITDASRNPDLAECFSYDPESDSVCITPPKWIRDRYGDSSGRLGSMPNEMNKEFNRKREEFLSKIGS